MIQRRLRGREGVEELLEGDIRPCPKSVKD
jgi:hypothetical protein